MTKTETILDAVQTLGIADSASLETIKGRYRELMKQWHPDRCGEEEARCREMAAKITAAYHHILEYTSAYRFSFREEDIARQIDDGDDWWRQRFGNDPMWA